MIEQATFSVFIHDSTRQKTMEILDTLVDCIVEVPTYVPTAQGEGFTKAGLRVARLDVQVR